MAAFNAKKMTQKQKDDLIFWAVAGVAGYFLVIRPVLEKLNVVPDAAERAMERAESEDVRQQSNIRVPVGSRSFNNASLESLVKEMYDAADKFNYDYPILMRSFAYFARMTNADALYFLKQFATFTGKTLYQWYREKFANTANFRTVDMYLPQYNRYKNNYARYGYKLSLLNASFDPLAEKAISYVYVVAKISKK